MARYRTAGDYEAGETVVEKSRFLTFVYAIDSEEQATQKLNALRKKYYDATHVCYAYIADGAGRIARSGDDGEPSGTAGAPILEALRDAGLCRTLVAVVRWFGGVKLGTGGLTRAYGGCAVAALKEAPRKNLADCVLFRLTCDYSVYKKIEKLLGHLLCKTLGVEYNKDVTLHCAVFCEDERSFAAKCTDLTLGRALLVREGEACLAID